MVPGVLDATQARGEPVFVLDRLQHGGGKSVAVSTPGSLTAWLVQDLSQHQGWGLDGIRLVYIGAEQSRVAGLRAGELGGIVVDLATGLQLERRQMGRIVADFGTLEPHFHIHVIFATDEIIAKNPDAVRHFLAGWFATIA
jgi:ABC-type nitrate/sulfonate/bicarbonate transport system substrate-binding protein